MLISQNTLVFVLCTDYSWYNVLSGYGKYIYFEASDPVQAGEKASFQSRVVKAGTKPKCMTFFYHMYGNGMGHLKLEKVLSNGASAQLFHNHGSYNVWRQYSVNLPTESSDYKVKWRYITCKSISSNSINFI